MATMPMSDPSQQPGAPADGGASDPSQGAQQANGLQKLLADWMHTAQQIGTQNQVIAPEMQEVMASLRKAFLKTVQAGNPPSQPTPAPPGQ